MRLPRRSSSITSPAAPAAKFRRTLCGGSPSTRTSWPSKRGQRRYRLRHEGRALPERRLHDVQRQRRHHHPADVPRRVRRHLRVGERHAAHRARHGHGLSGGPPRKKALQTQLRYLDLINALFMEVNPIPREDGHEPDGPAGRAFPHADVSDGPGESGPPEAHYARGRVLPMQEAAE